MTSDEELASRSAPRGPSRVVLCVLLAWVAWSGSLVRSGFSFDDREVLEGNPVVEGSVPAGEAFRRDYWEHLGAAGHYRPLATLSLRLDRALYGERALGYHLTNLLLHSACVALLGCVLLLAGPYPPGPRAEALPWFGLACFAAHPALADAVAWISGRTSMLSALGGLTGAGLLLALVVPARPAGAGRRAAVAAACGGGLVLALLGKEDGIVFALLYVALAARHSRGMLVIAVAGCALGLAAYLGARAAALGAALPSAPHAPLAAEPLVARLEVAGRALLEGLRLAVVPAGYPPSYEGSDFLLKGPRLLSLLGWASLAGLALGSLAALRRRPGTPAAWSGLLVAASLAPMLQVLPAGALFAPRFLYLPLLLAAPLVHAGFRKVTAGWARPAPLVASLIVLAVAGAWERAGVYASRGSFQLEVLRHAPDSAGAWNSLGLHWEEQGRLQLAREAFGHSVRCDPGYSRPWNNLGRLALSEGALEAAEGAFRRAVDLGPRNPTAHANLGSALLRSGRAAEAEPLYLRATELSPGMLAAWRGLARSRLDQGRLLGAREALERALELDPRDGGCRRLLVELETAEARG